MSLAPLSSFVTRRRVEFADTDLGRIVHFSRFFVFMETAEHELLRAIGTPVHFEHQLPDGRTVEVGWPRLAASCDYLSPAHYDDELAIEVRVARKGRRSMVYAVTFRCGERLIARGRLASICCVIGGPALEPVPIPPRIADRLAEDPAAAAAERARIAEAPQA